MIATPSRSPISAHNARGCCMLQGMQGGRVVQTARDAVLGFPSPTCYPFDPLIPLLLICGPVLRFPSRVPGLSALRLHSNFHAPQGSLSCHRCSAGEGQAF